MSRLSLRRSLVVVLVAALAGSVPTAQTSIDPRIVSDACFYLLSRAVVVRQEHTDLKAPGVNYTVIKYTCSSSPPANGRTQSSTLTGR